MKGYQPTKGGQPTELPKYDMGFYKGTTTVKYMNPGELIEFLMNSSTPVLSAKLCSRHGNFIYEVVIGG